MFLAAWTALALGSPKQKALSNSSAGLPTLEPRTELPGGTPFGLCAESRNTDLFSITSVELVRQPVHL